MTGENQYNLSWTRARILGQTSFAASNANSATSKLALQAGECGYTITSPKRQREGSYGGVAQTPWSQVGR